MIRLTTIASGSSGNCYTVECSYDSGSMAKLILEAGAPIDAVQKALKFDLQGLDGVLVSHEHSDHAKYAVSYTERGIKLFATAGTAHKIGAQRFTTILPLKTSLKVGHFNVMAFPTEHDAEEPCGFLIDCPDGNRIMFATDTYYLRYRFAGVTIYMIECNYEERTLCRNIKQGIVHASVGERVRTSHMSIDQCKKVLTINNMNMVKLILLIHLSNDNGNPERFRDEVVKATGKTVKVATKGKVLNIF